MKKLKLTQSEKLMRIEILKVLKNKNRIYLPDFYKYLDIKDIYSYYFPTQPQINQNILWCANVSQDFIGALHSLIVDNTITFEPIQMNTRNYLILMYDNCDMYNMKLFKRNDLNNQKEVWMPIYIDFVNKRKRV